MDKERIKGKVKWFNNRRGHGFLVTEDGKEVFVHYSDINDRGFITLKENEEVTFEVEQTQKGLKAKNVLKVKKNVKNNNKNEKQ